MKQIQTNNQNPNKLQQQAALANNALLRGQGIKKAQSGQSGISFKNHLAQVKQEAGAQRDTAQYSPSNFTNAQQGNAKAKATLASSLAGANPEKLTEEQQKMLGELQQMRKEELKKESKRKFSSENEKFSSEELGQKSSESETAKATASQANHKEITEALREGNQGQQQANHQDANDSRKHLENWEELAPKVVEDIKNRAVRIDIPGIRDVETLIVRMQGSSVSIQVVGSKKSMESLQNQESLLAALLAKKNVSMASLQAIDVMKVPAKNRAFANV